MVGEGLEEPGVVKELLDVERVTCKPQFKMADPEPLLLYECAYEELDGGWIRPEGVLRAFDREVDQEVRMLMTKAQVLLATRDRVLGSGSGDVPMAAAGRAAARQRHVPLLERNREPSIEGRLAKHGLQIVSREPRER